MYTLTLVLFACLCVVSGGKPRSVIRGVNEAVVCNIKRSCVDCLRLAHCSWCEAQSKCFSNAITPDFCKNDTINYTDFGFSFEENARCGCGESQGLPVGCKQPDEDEVCSGRGRCVCERCVCDTYENSTKNDRCAVRRCKSPGKDEVCSGRGRCVCERCVCDTYENSTKFVVGDYCEYDNFSCDGPSCNEGPYSLKPPRMDSEAP